MIKNLGKYIRTIYYLKLSQVLFRLFYSFRSKYRGFIGFNNRFGLYRKGMPLNFIEGIANQQSFESNKFTFLNRSVKFSDQIDWDYPNNGKLWTYNLNYFDFLIQEDISKEQGLALMYLMIDQIKYLQNANEPYPTSLRGMNWIKFISKNKIQKKSIDSSLYSQYRILWDNIEHHILGNHILENGFSLLFGAYYFNGLELFRAGKKILKKELKRQILEDGAHFELSPMYHQIMLNRVLDCYNLMDNNEIIEDDNLKDLLKESAQKMLGWLASISYDNGLVPRTNDSIEGIAPSSQSLFEYAERLNIEFDNSQLGSSGYRRWKKENYEFTIDIGAIGPDYIPGHAHSDTFSFELIKDKKPFIVDVGISTYESNNIRLRERSTISHNTVRYGVHDQSEVWGSFRVGRRARVKIKQEETNRIIAEHNGYKFLGVIHQRSFDLNEQAFVIKDKMKGNYPLVEKSSFFLHFHPSCSSIEVNGSEVIVDGQRILFDNFLDLRVLDYKYAVGFNLVEPAKMIEVIFDNELTTNIFL